MLNQFSFDGWPHICVCNQINALRGLQGLWFNGYCYNCHYTKYIRVPKGKIWHHYVKNIDLDLLREFRTCPSCGCLKMQDSKEFLGYGRGRFESPRGFYESDYKEEGNE